MIILAAGSSSRMGQPKQLLAWKNSNLINHVIANGFMAGIESIYVVVGAKAEEISNAVSFKNATILKNSMWKNGMGTSISMGVNYLINEPKKYEAALIALVDQPLLDESHFKELINEYLTSENEIIATQMKKRAGVPAIFSAKHFDKLIKLNQDIGAKEIIESHKNEILSIGPKNLIDDIDDIKTYNALFDQFGK